jgi:hypothetical protein
VSKIIIGYQEDERADDALALGRVLAEILDARPVVVAVATWPAYLLTADERDAALHQEFDEVLEVARDRLRDLNPGSRRPTPSRASSSPSRRTRRRLRS